jgi:hypothetical protein
MTGSRPLGLVVEVEELSTLNMPRAVQLLNKSNQMNLQTRRMSEEEFAAWSQESGCKVWTFRVRDRFGDYGPDRTRQPQSCWRSRSHHRFSIKLPRFWKEGRGCHLRDLSQ